MLERLGLEVELYEAHISPSRVSVIGGQVQEIRSIFDLMPTGTEDAWRNIAARLRTVHLPLDGVRETLSPRGPGRQHRRGPADRGHHRRRSAAGRARPAPTTSSPDCWSRPRPTRRPCMSDLSSAADHARHAVLPTSPTG